MKRSYKFNKNAMILLASDIHIGALKTKTSLFKDFLVKLIQGLENESLKNLKALVILGDCFDLIMDTYQNFFEDPLYVEILNKFEDLHNIDDFHLIFALGNHEVPVIGKYDNTFFKEKKDLLKAFNDVGNQKYTFFTEKNFSQYVMLKTGDSQETELNLFDTKQQIADEKGEKILLENIAPVNSNILLAHGFQFDPKLKPYSVVWNELLKIKSKVLKDLADSIWNGFFKEIYNQGKRLKHLVPDKIEELIKLQTKNHLKIDGYEIESFQVEGLDELIKNKCKADYYREKMDVNEFIEKIKEFLSKLNDLGYEKGFTHIIYGHTHRRWPRKKNPIYRMYNNLFKKKMSTDLFRVGNTILFNTGAWQHVDYPSFIQINNDGKINMVEIKPRKRKIQDKPLSDEIKQQLIQEQQEFKKKQQEFKEDQQMVL